MKRYERNNRYLYRPNQFFIEEKDYTDLRFSVPPESRNKTLKEVQQTSIFLRFIEERPYAEQKLLFAEIDNILRNGMPAKEYMEPLFTEVEAGPTDYRKIATFCFLETFMDFVQENRERTKDMFGSNDFTAAYTTAAREIGHYLQGLTDEFPRDAVRCLFLLTDGDIDPHRQGVITARLVMHSFIFCETDEQKEEIERLIKSCKLQ